mgnify:CR=1 FL=1
MGKIETLLDRLNEHLEKITTIDCDRWCGCAKELRNFINEIYKEKIKKPTTLRPHFVSLERKLNEVKQLYCAFKSFTHSPSSEETERGRRAYYYLSEAYNQFKEILHEIQ